MDSKPVGQSHGAQSIHVGYLAQACLSPSWSLPQSSRFGYRKVMSGNRLNKLRKKKGLTLEGLAQKVGTTKMQIQRLEKGTRRLSDHWIYRLAAALEVSPAQLLESEVPVVGKIGAGGSIIFDAVHDYGTAPRPGDAFYDLVGLEVEGDSMLPKFDPGDVVYIRPEPIGVDMSALGRYCACRLTSGETLLKILARGSAPDRFNLRSLNAAEMEDQELEWATPVHSVTLRSSRHI